MRYCLLSVAAELREVGRHRRRVAVRQQVRAEEHDDRDRADQRPGCRPGRTRRSRTGRRRPSSAASETTTLTGLPVSANSEPAWAANASGINSCDVGLCEPHGDHHHDGHQRRDRSVGRDERGQQRAHDRHVEDDPRRSVPARLINCWPTHAVTPVESSASLTTNSDAMNITVGSPKPAVACSISSTPVAHNDNAVPIGDDRHRHPVDDEQHHDGAEHDEGDRAVRHAGHVRTAPRTATNTRIGWHSRRWRSTRSGGGAPRRRGSTLRDGSSTPSRQAACCLFGLVALVGVAGVRRRRGRRRGERLGPRRAGVHSPTETEGFTMVARIRDHDHVRRRHRCRCETGCNTMTGGYTIEDGMLAPGELAQTMMACDAGAHGAGAVDQRLLAIGPVDRARRRRARALEQRDSITFDETG